LQKKEKAKKGKLSMKKQRRKNCKMK
jgi:hypothetical protein